MKLATLCLALFVPVVCSAENDAEPNSLQLVLPVECYAVPDVEMSIYFDNLVLTETPQAYRFEVECEIGKVEQRRWTVIPKPEDVGSHQWSVSIFDPDGKKLASGSTKLQVAPANAGVGSKIRLLIVGDSLTNATQYPNEIARLLTLPSNPAWKMLGTHAPKSAAAGVAHEGYGGWTWKRFASYYDREPNESGRKHHSPFVYLDQDGHPHLDVDRYVMSECESNPPDYIVFLLGINDCFGAPADDPAGIDRHIDAVFEHADSLLAAFRKAAPDAELGICLTTPPNSRQSAFQANYKDSYRRWGWKRIQHHLIQRELKEFDDRSDENLFIIPTQLNIDPIDGYPASNGVHPNTAGYKQIGSSIYSWLKWRLGSASR